MTNREHPPASIQPPVEAPASAPMPEVQPSKVEKPRATTKLLLHESDPSLNKVVSKSAEGQLGWVQSLGEDPNAYNLSARQLGNLDPAAAEEYRAARNRATAAAQTNLGTEAREAIAAAHTVPTEVEPGEPPRDIRASLNPIDGAASKTGNHDKLEQGAGNISGSVLGTEDMLKVLAARAAANPDSPKALDKFHALAETSGVSEEDRAGILARADQDFKTRQAATPAPVPSATEIAETEPAQDPNTVDDAVVAYLDQLYQNYNEGNEKGKPQTIWDALSRLTAEQRTDYFRKSKFRQPTGNAETTPTPQPVAAESKKGALNDEDVALLDKLLDEAGGVNATDDHPSFQDYEKVYNKFTDEERADYQAKSKYTWEEPAQPVIDPEATGKITTPFIGASDSKELAQAKNRAREQDLFGRMDNLVDEIRERVGKIKDAQDDGDHATAAALEAERQVYAAELNEITDKLKAFPEGTELLQEYVFMDGVLSGKTDRQLLYNRLDQLNATYLDVGRPMSERVQAYNEFKQLYYSPDMPASLRDKYNQTERRALLLVAGQQREEAFADELMKGLPTQREVLDREQAILDREQAVIAAQQREDTFDYLDGLIASNRKRGKKADWREFEGAYERLSAEDQAAYTERMANAFAAGLKEPNWLNPVGWAKAVLGKGKHAKSARALEGLAGSRRNRLKVDANGNFINAPELNAELDAEAEAIMHAQTEKEATSNAARGVGSTKKGTFTARVLDRMRDEENSRTPV